VRALDLVADTDVDALVVPLPLFTFQRSISIISSWPIRVQFDEFSVDKIEPLILYVVYGPSSLGGRKSRERESSMEITN
jgi:hypothetical protein